MSSPRILVVLCSFYASGFNFFRVHRLARAARQAVAVGLMLVLVGNHAMAAPQGMLALTRDVRYSVWFWWHASGWAASFAGWMRQRPAAPRAWDGRGAPDRDVPSPEPQETQDERLARVVRIEVFPQQLSVEAGEPAVFGVIGYDRNQEPVGTLPFDWSAEDEATGELVQARSKGWFIASKEGGYKLRVTSGGQSAEAKVTVTAARRIPGEKPIRTITVSSRDLPAPSRSTSSSPKTGGGPAGRVKTGYGGLAAAYTRGGTRVVPAMLPVGQDPYSWNDDTYTTADDPNAQRGNPRGYAADGGAGSSNFQVEAPLLNLKGRGLDLNLSMHYNSRLWHKAGSQILFDVDRDSRVPGWIMGFSRIVGAGGQNGYMLVEADGTRHPYTCSISFFTTYQLAYCKTTDGSLIDYTVTGNSPTATAQAGAPTSASAFLPDGTALHYGNVGASGANCAYLTHIYDTHGNRIYLEHRNMDVGLFDVIPKLKMIVDTMGRVIQFYYDSNDLLVAVTAPGFNGTRRTMVRINYVYKNLASLGANYGFSGLTPMVRNASIPVIKAIYYPANNTGYWFGDADSYSAYGMLAKVIQQRGMGFSSSPLPADPSQAADPGTITAGTMTRQAVYDYPMTASSLTDSPAYRNLTESWAGMNVASPVTHFTQQPTASPRRSEVVRADGSKLVMLSRNNPSQYDDGHMFQSEIYSPQGALLKRTSIEWELGDFSSARQTRVETTDERNQKTGTEFSYGPRFNQVTEVRDYDYGYVFGSGTLLKKTRYEYVADPIYSDFNEHGYYWKHILNLVSVKEVFAGDNVTRLERTEYFYDQFTGTAGLKNTPGFADPSYTEYEPGHSPYLHPSDYAALKFDYQGNLTTIKQYANAATLDEATAIVEVRHYDITGNVVQINSACCEQTTFNYTSNTKYAFPESQTRGAVSDATQQNTTSATYDFNTGLTKTTTDANGRISQVTYDSGSLRPLYEYSPTNAYNYYIYDDAGLVLYELT